MPTPPTSTPDPSTPLARLQGRIADRSVVVGIVGLGYVGLPLAHTFHAAGVQVLGFDIDPAKPAALKSATPYLKHLGDELWTTLASSDRFEATTDFARLRGCDAILICVPTPLGQDREPDLSYVSETVGTIANILEPHRPVLICLESTTYPGTTRDLVLPALAAMGMTAGESADADLFVAFSPEREDPGRTTHTTATIPKLVGGVNDASGVLAAELYRLAFTDVVPCPSAEVAESAKLLENIYRAVNIAMVNEMKLILEPMGIDVWAVIDAASTKPFGFQRFEPGPGLGGHCIPIDPFYLAWRAKQAGIQTRFIELAGEINTAMPGHVVTKVADALHARNIKVQDATVLVLGLAYKPNIDDVRESPSLELISRLRQMGANVSYNDPHVPATHRMRHYDLGMTSVDLTDQRLAEADCVLIATAHDAYDWERICAKARLIVDTRGATRHVHSPAAAIVRA